jgi:hypothetical protein
MSTKQMKYWLYLVAKLAIAFGALYGFLVTLARFYPVARPFRRSGPPAPLFAPNILFVIIWLVGAGLFWLILWDQRRRCRTCLRRLVMPIKTGSWGHMVIFGRPKTEIICPYGHGTLRIEELQITGRQLPDWQPHDDNIWKELESYSQARK